MSAEIPLCIKFLLDLFWWLGHPIMELSQPGWKCDVKKGPCCVKSIRVYPQAPYHVVTSEFGHILLFASLHKQTTQRAQENEVSINHNMICSQECLNQTCSNLHWKTVAGEAEFFPVWFGLYSPEYFSPQCSICKCVWLTQKTLHIVRPQGSLKSIPQFTQRTKQSCSWVMSTELDRMLPKYWIAISLY